MPAAVAMGRPASERESAGSATKAAVLLAQSLLDQLKPEQQEEERPSRAYVVSPEDVIGGGTEGVNGADMLLVVHEAPYELVCSKGAQAEDAAATCRTRGQDASALQSRLGRLHGGDMALLHLDGSAMRTFAGAVVIAQELLERWGLDADAEDLKAVVEDALLSIARSEEERARSDHAAIAARRHCIDTVDNDGVCRAWHEFVHELFPYTALPVIDGDKVTAWLPTALEAAAVAAEAEGDEEMQAAPVALDALKEEGGSDVTDDADDEELPALFYCLPGGGLNDITVEWNNCIEWAIKTGRTLVSGFENYLATVPPYESYFELTALPGLTTMTPAEAARRIRKARSKGKVTVFPRRLQRDPHPILEPVADSEEEAAAILAGERPWRFAWDNLHRLGFEFDREYQQQVVVFHRKGNVGAST